MKPCPFCGGEARVLHVANRKIVQCRSCGVATSAMHANAEAAWNKRIDAKEKK